MKSKALTCTLATMLAFMLLSGCERDKGPEDFTTWDSTAKNAFSFASANGSRTVSGKLPSYPGRDYTLTIFYSNDNDDNLPNEHIAVYIDDVLAGEFTSQDTGSFGQGWDDCVSWQCKVHAAGESMNFRMEITSGDGWGWSFWNLTLERTSDTTGDKD